MDVLLSIVAFFLAVMACALGWTVFRLRARMFDQETRLAALTRRVFELETSSAGVEAPEPVDAALIVPQPVQPAGADDISLPVEASASGAQDWEAVIGGNWLNRAGALVLVIGIALFLAYSLTQLGPGGKIAIGFCAGLSMLAAGVALRSSATYGSFSVSLVGGGWAAVYFTAYASHALPPARVIENAAAAGVVLFAVSAGMIVHALWYESEHGAALAFLFSFVSLNVVPLTGFSIYAALLLALCIVALAYVRRWFRLAVAGILLAYGTFVLRRDAAEPMAQWALWLQWFAFEAYDILDARRRGLARGIGRSVFFLNAAGFVGATLLYDWEHIGWFLFLSACAYLASTLLRARLLRVEDAEASARVLGGGYEGALLASAALMAAALVERFSGTNITLALLMEGEMIVLAGYALRNGFVRGLGGAVLSLVFVRVVLIDRIAAETDRIWTPTASLLAAVFLANRRQGGWAYTAGAGTLFALVTQAELPREWVAFVWAAVGTLALAAALRFGLNDVRLQHLGWSVITFFAGWIALDYGASATAAVALTVACFYVNQFLVKGKPAGYAFERNARNLYSGLGTVLFTLLLFEQVQGRLLTVALGAQGAALLVAGMFASDRALRVSGLVLFLICIGKAFVYDLRQLDTFSRIVSFIVLGLLLLGASWAYTRFRERIKRLL